MRGIAKLLVTIGACAGVLANANAFPAKDALTLAVWAVLGIALAARFFRWE